VLKTAFLLPFSIEEVIPMDARDLLVGAAAGSAVMFLLDPNGGRRRRALMRDRMVRATRKARKGLDATARDIANRTGGIAAETRKRLSRERVHDAKLVARVRAKLGRASSHPGAIEVDAHDGHVILRGAILDAEMNDVLAAATAARGVNTVDCQVDVYETAERIPSLQGEGRVGEPSLDILQRSWSPATRAMVGAGLLATGVWIAMNAMRHPQQPEYQYGSL
jgi:gas vesicle protein